MLLECGNLNQCHTHVALIGSPYDSEVIRESIPTLSKLL